MVESRLSPRKGGVDFPRICASGTGGALEGSAADSRSPRPVGAFRRGGAIEGPSGCMVNEGGTNLHTSVAK